MFLASFKAKRPMHQGLGKGGVCLLQKYCPFCFKGMIGVSCGLHVTKQSHLVDPVQVFHSSQGNGLPPIDLAAPGEYCENQALCKMVCLVCGKTTIDGEDPAFESFLDFFDEGDDKPVTLKYDIREAMEEHGLVFVNQTGKGKKKAGQWDTPVHTKCTFETVCECIVPLGVTTCPTHNVYLVPRQIQELTCMICGQTTIGSDDKDLPKVLDFLDGGFDQSPPQTDAIQKAVAEHELVWITKTDAQKLQAGPWDAPVHAHCAKKTTCECVVPLDATVCPVHKKPLTPPQTMTELNKSTFQSASLVTVTQGRVMEKAGWLPTPSKMAICETPHHQPPPASKTEKKQLAPPKPSVQAERLKKAADTCAFKITKWAGTHPTNTKLAGIHGDAGLQSDKPSTKFSLADHNANFDDQTDGPWLINGECWYKPHNGPLVRTSVGVNTLNEDGTMTPLVPA